LRSHFGFVLSAVLLSAGVSRAADKLPTAVLWMGEPTTIEEGLRVTEDVNAGLRRSPTARPLDSAEDRRTLVEGGTTSRAALLQARAEALFVKLKMADAAKEYQAAEELLLTDVPIGVTQSRLGAVERNLLVIFDQQGRKEEAARAAERLGWTAGANEDVRPLLDKHLRNRAWQPAFAPVRVISEPPGAQVYRNLQPIGVTPIEVAGGDPAVDVIDLELKGHRRAHEALGRTGGEIRLALVKEDRLGALVDQVRVKAPEAPPGEVAAIGKRVGAPRVLVLLPDGPQKVMARWLDVKAQKWGADAIRVDSAGQPAMDKLAGYVAPAGGAPGPAPAGVVEKKPTTPTKSKWGAWGKWYTWVAAGGVLALVAGLLIAQNVGDDSLKINVTK
jgi:hypothetical protein